MTEFEKALFKLQLNDPPTVPKLTELLLELRGARQIRFSKGWLVTLVPALIYFGFAAMYLFGGKADWTAVAGWSAMGVFFLLLGVLQIHSERQSRIEELFAQMFAELVAQNNQLRRDIDLINSPPGSPETSINP